MNTLLNLSPEATAYFPLQEDDPQWDVVWEPMQDMAALALAPANITANRRLGQIELSLGQYQAARRHLEAAYAAAPNQRATRQLLGESYALAGEIERAAALWRSIDVSQGQLRLRQRWYDYIGELQQGARLARAVAGSTAD